MKAPTSPYLPAAADMSTHATDAARLLKALANENRLMILCLLAESERSVSDINELVGLSQSALSQHLAVLREEDLVRTRRDAQTIYYSLRPGPAAAVIETLYGIYCRPASAQARTPRRKTRGRSAG